MSDSPPSTQLRVPVAGVTLIPSLHQKILGAVVGAVLTGLVFVDSKAQALVVTVNGQDWDVTTFVGAYLDNNMKPNPEFETPENGGLMPWWGSSTDALVFATAVGASLGTPNSGGRVGPRFSYAASGVAEWTPSTYNPAGGTAHLLWSSPPSFYTYTKATLVPAAGSASVPGPLPILGLAAAFGFSRKLRKRIQLHKGTSDISVSTGA